MFSTARQLGVRGVELLGNRNQTKDFYVRINNGTRSLDIEDALDYITTHNWHQR